MLTKNLKPYKHAAHGRNAHFDTPGAHVIRPKIDRVRRAALSKETKNPKRMGGLCG